MKKICVVGLGYVGTSLSILLSKKNKVIALDIDKKKVDKINNKISPIKDDYASELLTNAQLNLSASKNKQHALRDSALIIIATPTDYDPETNQFNTKSVESVVHDILKFNSDAVIVIKSTVPLGFTDKLRKKYNNKKIIFSPEFLREGKAVYDNMFPSRLIVGDSSIHAKEFATTLLEVVKKPKKSVQVLFMGSKEAEAVKLFSNTYLAMRVSFFNELDTFANELSLSTKSMIDGICLDPRIGNHYNNPSFGYGGYCLPKDTKQLLANFHSIPNKLIKAIVESNKVRKNYITDLIIKKKINTVGIFRIVMKSGSDNFRDSAVQDIIVSLLSNDINVIIYEPFIKETSYLNAKLVKDLKFFKDESDLILTNRKSSDLSDVKDKIFSRDVYNKD